ncbi:hypothetical protein E2542_SST12257 [Spatholobus suberectus]|nr:hypothetical protein E2542_SST12257 [Spatholobus suberectus]
MNDKIYKSKSRTAYPKQEIFKDNSLCVVQSKYMVFMRTHIVYQKNRQILCIHIIFALLFSAKAALRSASLIICSPLKKSYRNGKQIERERKYKTVSIVQRI